MTTFRKQYSVVFFLFLITLATAQTKPTGSLADIFFLDLGIFIEPATGTETVSRLIESPSEEVRFRINKVESGSVYMATSREVLEALERITHQMEMLEGSFQSQITSLRDENKELREILSGMASPLVEPDRPTLAAQDENDLALMDETFSEHLPLPNVLSELDPLPELKPAVSTFDQSTYMAGVFAYQREDYRMALKHFSKLALNQTSPRTAGNILYWMADAYNQLGGMDEALEILDRLLLSAGTDRIDDALIRKGLLYRKIGREDQALAAFTQVVNQHPDSEYTKLAKMELKKAEMIP